MRLGNRINAVGQYVRNRMRGARVLTYVVSSARGDLHEDQTAYRSGSAWHRDPGGFQRDFGFDSVGHACRQSGECRID